MATEVHAEGAANGNLRKEEVEPLGELKGTTEDAPISDLKCHLADAGPVMANGCEAPAEKDEPFAKISTPNKLKEIIHDDAENENDLHDGRDISSEEEADAEEGDDAEVEDDEDEEYADDGEDEEDGDNEDDSQPPPKRRK